jgi:hypothetical protein
LEFADVREGAFSEVGPLGSEVSFTTPRTEIVRLIAQVRKVPPPDSCAAAEDLQGSATIAKLVNIALLNGEAVEDLIPAGAAEVALAATASKAGLQTGKNASRSRKVDLRSGQRPSP